MTNTAEYDLGLEVGNLNSKGKTDNATTVIRNVVVPYDGTEDQLRDLGLLNIVTDEAAKPTDDAPQSDSIRFFFEDRHLIAGEAAFELSVRTYSTVSYMRYGTQEWKDMVAATLARLRKRSGSIRATFAIPVALFKHEERDEQGRTKKEQIRDLLLRSWDIYIDDAWRQFEFIPEDLQIVPEGLGILWYLLLSADGMTIKDRDLAKKAKVIFDFGGFNASVLTFEGTQKGVYNESLTTGLLHVRSEVNRKLKSRYSRGDLSDRLLDKVIATSMYSHAGGPPESVKDIVQNAMAPLVKEVLAVWQRDLANGADFGAVILGGGGSAVFGEMLKPQLGHKNVIIVPKQDAALAGAIGLWRLRKFRREYSKAQQPQP